MPNGDENAPQNQPTPQAAQSPDVLAPLSKAQTISADTSRWTAVKSWLHDFHSLPSNEFDAKWKQHPLTDYFLSRESQEKIHKLVDPFGFDALEAEIEKRRPGTKAQVQETISQAVQGAAQPGGLSTPMVGVIKPPMPGGDLLNLFKGLKGHEPVAPGFEAAAKTHGVEFRGIQKGVEGEHPGLAIFQDPKSGTSVGVRLDEWHPDKLGEHVTKARERMGPRRPEAISERLTAEIPGHKVVSEAPKAESKGAPYIAKGAEAFANKEINPSLDVKHDPEFGKRTADAFDKMEHAPNDPTVKKSYESLKTDIKDQWNYATEKLGIKYEPWTKSGQPYANSKEMVADLRDNKHLYFFQGGEIPKDHPMAAVDPETKLSYNDMFRAVHDTFGHAAHGHEFGPTGERRAYVTHSQMMKPESVPALTTETHGQNSWVNYGAHLRTAEGKISAKGEAGHIPPAERPFAKQKAGLLPEEFHGAEAGKPEQVEPAKSTSEKLVEKYGTTDDHLKAGFILNDGRMVPLHQEHDFMINIAEGKLGNFDPRRYDFISDEKAIRIRYYPSGVAGEGQTISFSVPEKVTPEQIDQMKLAVGKLGRYGNVQIENVSKPDGGFAKKEFVRPSDVDEMLHKIGAHPETGKPKVAPAEAPEKAGEVDLGEIGGGQHERLAARFEKEPSGAVNHLTGESDTKGVGVEVYPEARRTFKSPATPEQVQEFIEDNKEILEKHPELRVGWDRNGRELNLGAAGTREGATAVGKKLDQRAAWDIEKGEEVPTGGKGKATEFKNYPLEQRLAELKGEVAKPPKLGKSPVGSSVPLMKSPLPVMGTGEEGRVTTLDVAKELNKYTKEKIGALELSEKTEPEMRKRAAKLAEDEARYQLAQNNTGEKWYTEDIAAHDKVLQDMRPELKDADKLSLFKMAESIASSGQKPYQNLKTALQLWDGYQKTGQFLGIQESGKSWGPRKASAYAMALDSLNQLIAEKGEAGASKWLLSDHPISELRRYMSPKQTPVPGKATDTAPGAMILGAKRGPFAMNLHGREAEFTADRWVTRTWNRWMGTFDIEQMERDPDGGQTPRNERERQLMKQSFETAAKKLGKSTSSLQAILWYYEQGLYSQHSVPKESWSFSDAAKRVREESRQRSISFEELMGALKKAPKPEIKKP